MSDGLWKCKQLAGVQRSEKGGRWRAAPGPVIAGWRARISEGGEEGNDLMKGSEPRVEVKGALSVGKVDGEGHCGAERRAQETFHTEGRARAGRQGHGGGMGHALAPSRQREGTGAA